MNYWSQTDPWKPSERMRLNGQCPYCDGPVHAAGFSGSPFCWKCYRYVKPKDVERVKEVNID